MRGVRSPPRGCLSLRFRWRRVGEAGCGRWERRRAEGAAWPGGTEAEGGRGGPGFELWRGLRTGPGLQRPPFGECPAPRGSRGRPVLASGSGWGSRESGRAGEPAEPSRPSLPVETRLAMAPTGAGGSAGSVETGLLALSCEETEWGLLLYNWRFGRDQFLLGCFPWSASVSQTTARTKTYCRRLPPAELRSSFLSLEEGFPLAFVKAGLGDETRLCKGKSVFTQQTVPPPSSRPGEVLDKRLLVVLFFCIPCHRKNAHKFTVLHCISEGFGPLGPSCGCHNKNFWFPAFSILALERRRGDLGK